MSSLSRPTDASRAGCPGQPPAAGSRWLHLPRSRGRKLLFLATYLLFCWGVVVAGSKLFWKFRAGVPLDETPLIWDCYYPEIRQSEVETIHPRHGDDRFDVLLLGGSVLEPSWGDVEPCLTGKLRAELGDGFRLFNLGHSAHTSRDSLLKYAKLSAEQFELVIVYDGINDVRMNCCPRQLFRDDYTHCAWYRAIEKRLRSGRMSLPAGPLEQASLMKETVAFDPSNAALLDEGRDIKTVGPLRGNHEEILRAAAARKDTVLLMTFAYDIPGDYTQERFKSHALDYSYRPDGRSCGAEMWGHPGDVAASIAAQNEAIRLLAGAHPEVLFVDQRKLMPEEGRLFVDPCHLSEEGSRRFVENLWPAVKRRLEAWQAAR